MKYYTTTKIDRKKATYNLIIGERSNGKSYALLKKALYLFTKEGKQFAYVRRWQEDIRGRRASMIFEGINKNDEVVKATNGKFTGIHYYAGKFFLCVYDENGKPIYSDKDVIGFLFAISNVEHDKSTSYPNVGLIIFDEFLSKRGYLPDEFVAFMNLISTVVRKRTDVIIYMLGNTVSKHCPYFQEMGLNHIQKMKPGAIDLYTYGESKLTVAVEYCKTIDNNDALEANKYFAFDNPKLQMITGGAWEIDIYPHLPFKYKPKDILLTYFIEFNDSVFQCEVINIDDVYFTYIHIKTTPIQNPDSDMIYSLEFNPRPNYSRSIFKPTNNLQKRIMWFFNTDRVFYQDNHVGDAISNFLKICKRGL